MFRIRIGFNADPDPDPGFRLPKTVENLQLKDCLIFLNKKLKFSYPYRPPYRTSKLQQKPSPLKREHPALQNMKFINFFLSFFVGLFCPPGFGSGSSRPK